MSWSMVSVLLAATIWLLGGDQSGVYMALAAGIIAGQLEENRTRK